MLFLLFVFLLLPRFWCLWTARCRCRCRVFAVILRAWGRWRTCFKGILIARFDFAQTSAKKSCDVCSWSYFHSIGVLPHYTLWKVQDKRLKRLSPFKPAPDASSPDLGHRGAGEVPQSSSDVLQGGRSGNRGVRHHQNEFLPHVKGVDQRAAGAGAARHRDRDRRQQARFGVGTSKSSLFGVCAASVGGTFTRILKTHLNLRPKSPARLRQR